MGRHPPQHEILDRLLLRLVRAIPTRPIHTALPPPSMHAMELQHSHATGFHHRRVWTVCVSVRALHGQGIGPSPLFQPVWDDGARPTGRNDFRAGVWATTPTPYTRGQCCTCRKGECLDLVKSWGGEGMARGPIVNSPFICFSNIRGRRASPPVSSLYEMSNLKLLVTQYHGVPRQASGSQHPPAERVLLRRLYFLNSDRSNYVCLGFYSSWLPGLLRAWWGKACASNLASISHPYTGTSPT